MVKLNLLGRPVITFINTSSRPLPHHLFIVDPLRAPSASQKWRIMILTRLIQALRAKRGDRSRTPRFQMICDGCNLGYFPPFQSTRWLFPQFSRLISLNWLYCKVWFHTFTYYFGSGCGKKWEGQTTYDVHTHTFKSGGSPPPRLPLLMPICRPSFPQSTSHTNLDHVSQRYIRFKFDLFMQWSYWNQILTQLTPLINLPEKFCTT